MHVNMYSNCSKQTSEQVLRARKVGNRNNADIQKRDCSDFFCQLINEFPPYMRTPRCKQVLVFHKDIFIHKVKSMSLFLMNGSMNKKKSLKLL